MRTLRDSVLLSDLARRPRSVMVTSATPREGKTTSTVHLAIAHSLQQRKTLLIDADLRRPGIHSLFGLSNRRGLRDVALDEAEWREVRQKVEAYPDLDIIVGGEASRRAADRVGSALKKMLPEARAGVRPGAG